MQSLLNLFDLYGERFLVVGVSLLSLTFVTLMFLWSYNRRRFMAYKHHIPARVMQGYLDSVIQNSSALKSSLLRGGGADSVPLINPFPSVEGMVSSGAGSSANPAELAQKNAELASLRSQITEKDSMISDLEEKMADLLGKLREAEDNMGKFQTEAKAFANHAAVGGDEATVLQLSEVTKERDLLKEKLKEYEFIESDLAEIPRLQRAVETYKATLKQLGVDPDDALAGKVSAPAPAAAASAPAPVTETKPAEQPAVAPKTEEVAAAPAAAAEAPAKKGNDDDLLQQFEKMLG